jgi:phosphatidylglycerophosphate synthase
VGLDFGIVLILYSIAIGTDLIDGHVARRFNCIGKHGAYFDALADFVLIVAVYSALACIQRISWLLVMVPVVMFGQFILSTLVGFKVYDPVGKYAGSFHMIVQLLLLLPVCGSYNIVLTAIVFLFSGACIFSRYRNSISMVFARSTRELST